MYQLQQLHVEIEAGTDPFAGGPFASLEHPEHQRGKADEQHERLATGDTSRWLNAE